MTKKKEKEKEKKDLKTKEKEVKEIKDKIKDDDNKSDSGDKEKIAELEAKVKELQESLLRKAAEFENYKRRTENDQLNLIKYAAEGFILKILPVYDDLGRSVLHLDESNLESIKEGLKLVYDKFTKILDEQGVSKIESKGKEFDVEYHEALMQQPSVDVPSNTVLEEVEAGYLYKDKVIKHSKVIVSQEVETPVENGDEQKNDNEE